MLLFESVHLINLNELNLTFRSDNMFGLFEMLYQHWPLLERIWISLKIKVTSISWTGANFILKHWKHTFTHVSIYLSGIPSLKSYHLRKLPYQLDLPRVEYLKITFVDGCPPLNISLLLLISCLPFTFEGISGIPSFGIYGQFLTRLHTRSLAKIFFWRFADSAKQ